MATTAKNFKNTQLREKIEYFIKHSSASVSSSNFKNDYDACMRALYELNVLRKDEDTEDFLEISYVCVADILESRKVYLQGVGISQGRLKKMLKRIDRSISNLKLSRQLGQAV